MSNKILSAENVDNLLWLCGASDRSESAARIRASHAAQAERIEELKAAVIRRSGSSSWQEWTGIWDPTEETAVEATKRLLQRAEAVEKREEKIAQSLHPHKSKKGGWTYVPEQFPLMIAGLIQRAEKAELLLRQIREVLPAERAREIAEQGIFCPPGERYANRQTMRSYAALLESNAPTLPVPTWQQQAERAATDFMEKDGHRWVRMTSEEEAVKRLAESLV